MYSVPVSELESWIGIGQWSLLPKQQDGSSHDDLSVTPYKTKYIIIKHNLNLCLIVVIENGAQWSYIKKTSIIYIL